VRWRKDEERPERVDAVEYIELLEAEVEELKKQLELRGRGKNELLDYLKSLQPQNLQVNQSLRIMFSHLFRNFPEAGIGIAWNWNCMQSLSLNV
jgi:hypothetical protein